MNRQKNKIAWYHMGNLLCVMVVVSMIAVAGTDQRIVELIPSLINDRPIPGLIWWDYGLWTAAIFIPMLASLWFGLWGPRIVSPSLIAAFLWYRGMTPLVFGGGAVLTLLLVIAAMRKDLGNWLFKRQVEDRMAE